MRQGERELGDTGSILGGTKEEETSPQAPRFCNPLCDGLRNGTLAASHVAVEPQDMMRGGSQPAQRPGYEPVNQPNPGLRVASGVWRRLLAIAGVRCVEDRVQECRNGYGAAV